MEAPNNFLTSAAAWTLQNSLEASLLVAALFLIVWLGGTRLAPRFRAALWILVGVRLLLPFAPESSWSVFNLAPRTSEPVSTGMSFAAESPGELVTVYGMEEIPVAEESFDATKALSIAWLAGVLGILLWSVIRQIRTARWVRRLPGVSNSELRGLLTSASRRAGVPLRLRFVEAPSGSGVAVFGFASVTHLIVPADLEARYSEEEIRGILLHELEHVRRRDLIWNWATLFVQALHWFNPLVWVAGRRFLADREVVCDRAALECLPRNTRREYGATLIKALELGRHPAPNPALVPFISRKTELKHRLTMITKSSRQGFLAQAVVAVLTAAVCIATFTSATAEEESKARGERTERENSERAERGARESAERGARESAERGERESGRRKGARDEGRPSAEAGRGDRPSAEAERGARPSAEAGRDGDRVSPEGGRGREGDRAMMGMTVVRVFEQGVVFGDKEVRNEDLGDYLKNMSRRPGGVVITARPDVPFKAVVGVVNALKEAGIHRIEFRAANDDRRIDAGGGGRLGVLDGNVPTREGARDGEGVRREGRRDGNVPAREGARDGEGAKREGPRDGEGPRREGPRDGDAPAREGGATLEMEQRNLNQWTRIFGAYDKDKNKKVTFEEWLSMKDGEMPADRREREQGWFNQADASGDGGVTLGEWIDWKSKQGRGER